MDSIRAKSLAFLFHGFGLAKLANTAFFECILQLISPILLSTVAYELTLIDPFHKMFCGIWIS
jgi:hypothetical protein